MAFVDTGRICKDLKVNWIAINKDTCLSEYEYVNFFIFTMRNIEVANNNSIDNFLQIEA